MRKTKLIITIIAWLIGIIWTLPFMGIFMASIRPFSEVSDGWWKFEKFNLTLNNYENAWNFSNTPVGNSIFNSIIISVPSTMIPILVGSLMGYALARFDFPFKKAIFILLILIMAMPAISIILPLFRLLASAGLADSRLGLILVHSAWGTPWVAFFLRNFFLSIPTDLEESARVDGASELTIFRRIVVPIAIPALISVAVLQFIWVWNDFFFALVLLISPEKWVATQTLPLIKGRYFIDWSLVSAASVIVMLIPLLVFIILQRYFVKGVMAGAIKG
jgi:multiple sugar transport system permease protein